MENPIHWLYGVKDLVDRVQTWFDGYIWLEMYSGFSQKNK